MTRILIVDDHRAVADGLQAVLGARFGADSVAVASDPAEALEEAERFAPQVVLLDIDLPGASGFDLLDPLRERAPECRVVFFSMYANPDFVLRAIGVGASGYLVKDERAADVAAAIDRVAAGEPAFSTGVARIASLLGIPVTEDAAPEDDALTERERDVALELARGTSLQQCAKKLGLRLGTVRTYWARAQVKLRLRALPARRLAVTRSD